MKSAATYSFVIPFMNEEAVLPALLERITALMDKVDGPSEVVLIDDGSLDQSAVIVTENTARDTRIK